MLSALKISQKLFTRQCFHFQKIWQQRSYCQSTRTCWSCNASLPGSSDFFCQNCNSLQKVPKEMDYFNLLRIDKHHLIDANELTKNFRDVQNQIHPDKFSGKSKEEQKLSAEWSSLINKAYTILQNPLKRGMYLLKSEGMELPEENTITDTEFLMEMLERNEEVEDAKTKVSLEKLLVTIRDDMAELSNHFSIEYYAGNYYGARDHLIKLKYLTSIEQKIKERISQHH